MDYQALPVGEILADLARRIRAERLNQNLTQQELADAAGISIDTVRSLEAGGNATMTVFIKVLRALGLEDRIGMVVPSPVPSPIEVARQEGRVRERATGTRGEDDSSAWEFLDAPSGSPPGTA